jgi:hypothetical protein
MTFKETFIAKVITIEWYNLKIHSKISSINLNRK